MGNRRSGPRRSTAAAGAGLASLALAGCSLLFTAPPGEGNGGGGQDGGVDPTRGEVFEGTGAMSPSGISGRPLPLVLRGQFPQNVQITLDDGGLLTIGPTTVSASGALAAIEISVPVLEDLGAGSELRFPVLASGGGRVDEPADVVVLGLPELAASGSVDSIDLQPRYSSVVLSDPVFTGSAAARVRATAFIAIDGLVASRGRGRDGGAGGCDGNAPGEPNVACASNGGPGAQPNGGGGGGGAAEEGASGLRSNVATGNGGAPSGNDRLLPLSEVRPGGGGRGAGAGGGGGGGSGGVIELSSEGPVLFAEGSAFSLAGADGLGGADDCSTTGGGGGGAGGALLLRTHAGIDNRELGIVDVSGGPGGGSNAICLGGNGSPGRARVDSPEIGDGFIASPVRRGPMFVDLPTIVIDSMLEVTIAGDSAVSYGLTVNFGIVRPFQIDAGGSGLPNRTVLEVSLVPGLNQLCLLADPSAMVTLDEAVNCQAVAYIPR